MSRYPESIDKITRARLAASAVGSVLSIALTMFFVGVLVFLAFFSTKFIRNLSSKMEMEVLFYSQESGVKEADIIAFEQTLKLQPYVATSRVSSQADNVAEAKRVIGNNYEEVIPNPINASIILTRKNTPRIPTPSTAWSRPSRRTRSYRTWNTPNTLWTSSMAISIRSNGSPSASAPSLCSFHYC